MLTLSHYPKFARTALGVIKAVVRNPDGTIEPELRWLVAHPAHASFEDMAEFKKHVSEEQVVEIGSVIARLGFNSRWNVLMEPDLVPEVTTFVQQRVVQQRGYTDPGNSRAKNLTT